MTDLMTAYEQWKNRPDDERFWTLDEMYESSLGQARESREQKIENAECLSVISMCDNLALQTGEQDLTLNNWSFGQLCKLVKAPPGYLVGLDSPDLAAECLNKGIAHLDADERCSGLSLLTQADKVRAVTSQRYTRLWDTTILQRLIPLVNEQGWRVPPARPVRPAHSNSSKTRVATEADITDSSWMNPGDVIGPAGLYRGDRDMFCFMINDDVRIDDGSDGGISRGFIVQNSEVGNRSFVYTEFGFRHTCSNHIIWGVENVHEVRLRHVGADMGTRAFQEMECRLVEYAEESAEDNRLMIKNAKSFILGKDKEEVIDFLFGKRLMSQTLAKQAYDTCEQLEEQLNPRSAWGIVNGISRISQDARFADKRQEIDAISGKLFKAASHA